MYIWCCTFCDDCVHEREQISNANEQLCIIAYVLYCLFFFFQHRNMCRYSHHHHYLCFIHTRAASKQCKFSATNKVLFHLIQYPVFFFFAFVESQFIPQMKIVIERMNETTIIRARMLYSLRRPHQKHKKKQNHLKRTTTTGKLDNKKKTKRKRANEVEVESKL